MCVVTLSEVRSGGDLVALDVKHPLPPHPVLSSPGARSSSRDVTIRAAENPQKQLLVSKALNKKGYNARKFRGRFILLLKMKCPSNCLSSVSYFTPAFSSIYISGP